MNSTPGRLTGGGIRRLPADRIPPMLARLKIRHKKGFRVKSARYRITGFRGPSGEWISRDPKTGRYYKLSGRARAGSERRAAGQAARRRTEVKPTAEILRQSDMFQFEVEIDRGQGPRIYYVSGRP